LVHLPGIGPGNGAKSGRSACVAFTLRKALDDEQPAF
jgi:hypothetical protein